MEITFDKQRTANTGFAKPETVNPTELRWIERVKHKELSSYSLICSKCEGSASTHADLQFTIKEKPLKVIWQTAFWDNLSNQSVRRQTNVDFWL